MLTSMIIAPSSTWRVRGRGGRVEEMACVVREVWVRGWVEWLNAGR